MEIGMDVLQEFKLEKSHFALETVQFGQLYFPVFWHTFAVS